jgi:hypothetical protein
MVFLRFYHAPLAANFLLVPFPRSGDNQTTMKGLLALIIALAIGMCIYYLYIRQVQTTGGGNNPTQAITSTGVKNDLNAIAQAERAYFSEHGNYVTLDTLTESGALSTTTRQRDGYTYSVDVSSSGFTVTARSSRAGQPAFAIDQSMQIRPIP